MPRSNATLQHLRVVRKILRDLAYASTTTKTYRSAVRHYQTFCHNRSMTPLPMSLDKATLFLAYWIDSGYQVASFRSALSAIKAWSEEINMPWLNEHELHSLGLHLTGAQNLRPQQAARMTPFTLDILMPLLRRLDYSTSEHAVYATMARLQHGGLLRFKEVAELDIAHVTWEADAVCIAIHQGKSGKGEPPQMVYLFRSEEKLSPYNMLKAYWQRFNIDIKPKHYKLFPRLKKHSGVMQPFFSQHPTTNSTYKEFLRLQLSAMGISHPEKFSTHSFRSGGATDMWRRGTPLEVIQRFGRWKSMCFLIYIRASAKEIGRQAWS